MATIKPRYCDSEARPAAVPLSLKGNHLTLTAVTALIMKGWATASTVCAAIWAAKLPAQMPFARPARARRREPIPNPALIPRLSRIIEAGMQAAM